MNNGPLIENYNFYLNTDKEVPYDKNYKVPIINIVQFSMHEMERGNLFEKYKYIK